MMKKPITAIVSGAALAILAAPMAFSQTPDGETPAEESVCDPLKEDGVTKGLYGLCIAFCEAQDHADEDEPITPEALDALADDAPSGRILENYNRKKDKANNPADLPMPCILVQEPCPCWTAAELAAIDGLSADGSQPASAFQCFFGGSTVRLIREVTNAVESSSALARFSGPGAANFCRYRETRPSPFGSVTTTRLLSVGAGTLTDGQAEQRLQEVNDACAAHGL